jgi:IMP dehydrogenase
MLGSPLPARRKAPGRGTQLGHGRPSPTLPRGTRIKVGTVGTLERILSDRPTSPTDREPRRALRPVDGGARCPDDPEMQRVEMVYAPSTQTEGKSWQRSR